VIRAGWVLLAAAIVGMPRAGSTQQPVLPGAMPELRLDVIAGHQPSVQLGVGAQIPVGYYVRVGADVAAGMRTGEPMTLAGGSRLDGRLDVLVRFLLDPFRQAAYGLSLGGGMSVRAEPGDRARPLLLAAIDLEGRRSSAGLVPAIQLGLGGGVRIGVILRRGSTGGR
jgi:hypothetical protein